MNSIWDTPFIVVDVETSGSSPRDNRITDIACIKVIGGEIVSYFESLINPHQFIPPFITKMTGITNEMAFAAPEAVEVIPRALDCFAVDNSVFVAHNVSFDFGFLNETVIRLGLPPLDMPKLCTLKLARRILTPKMKKGVGALINYYNIPVKNRHRALGDALATAQILIELLEQGSNEHDIETIEDLLQFQNIPIKHFRPSSKAFKRVEEKLKELPDEPGVYYFLGKFGTVLYIGKAKSLRDRVKSYFQSDGFTSRKIAEMVRMIYDIKWEPTGTELSALLFESKEIKRHNPPYNTVGKIYKEYTFIKLTCGEDFPVIRMTRAVEQDGGEYFGPFGNPWLAQEAIQMIDKEFNLRKCDKIKLNKLGSQPCIYYQIEKCGSPCSEIMSKSEYSEEVQRVREFLSGVSNGIVSRLEDKMNAFSDSNRFEEAALVRDRIFQLNRLFGWRQKRSASINSCNFIYIFPAASREKTAELIFVKTGKLIHQELLGRKAPLARMFNLIHNNYYNSEITLPLTLSEQDTDEIKIINSWMSRQNGCGKIIHLDGYTESQVRADLEYAVRNIEFYENEIPTEQTKNA